jgi:hypothetical protein
MRRSLVAFWVFLIFRPVGCAESALLSITPPNQVPVSIKDEEYLEMDVVFFLSTEAFVVSHCDKSSSWLVCRDNEDDYIHLR